MQHLMNIKDIEQTICNHRLCLFYIKAPDCGVCNVMLDKVGRMVENHPQIETFYTDIIEEPLVAGRFLVYSGPPYCSCLMVRRCIAPLGSSTLMRWSGRLFNYKKFATYDLTQVYHHHGWLFPSAHGGNPKRERRMIALGISYYELFFCTFMP